MVPGRKFSITTSACFTRSRKMAFPLGFFRFRVTPFLFLLRFMK
jgi:hypothetical protein